MILAVSFGNNTINNSQDKVSNHENDSVLLDVIQIVINLSNKQTLIVDELDNTLVTYRKSSKYQIRTLSNNDCVFWTFNMGMGTNVDSELFQNDFLLAYKKVVWLKLYEYFVDVLR